MEYDRPVRRALVLAIACGSACSQIFGLDPPKIVGDGGSCAFRSVSAARNATCAVDGTGKVWCWGDNRGGQAQPDGDRTQPVVVPTQIVVPSAAVQVSVGNLFACARLEDGSVWCWGDNQKGELGNGDTAMQTTPVRVMLGNDAALDVDAGATHACARLASNGAVACWGDNSALDLGQPSTVTTQAIPSAIPGTEGSIAFAVGHRHACAVDGSGRVQCWGRNRDSQLGNSIGSASASLQQVTNLGAVSTVGASGRESCAIEQLGDVRCWGANESGELGNGTFTSGPIPGAAAVAGAAEVHAGAFGACARLLDGTVQCWGSLDAGDGQLVISAMARPATLTGAVAMSVKFNHTCVSTGDRILCWGSNDEGELGRGVRSISPSPVPVTLPGGASAAAVGATRVCAVVGGRLYCWGQAGLGDTTANGHVAPIETAASILGATVAGVSLSPYSNGCAWSTAGSAYCWGNNGNGQIGNGTTSIYETSPTAVSTLTSVVHMAQSDHHTCAALSGGPLYCWGDNSSYQLGDGTNVPKSSPLQVNNISNVSKVGAGFAYTCALGGSGLKCWGANYFGQIGDGTVITRSVPTAITMPSGSAVVDFAIGDDNTCAVTAAGELYCWGSNKYGQLGLGDYTDRHSPTQVPLPGAATAVSGGDPMCVLLATGKTYCWGTDFLGQFGDGTTIDSLVPRAVPALDGMAAIRSTSGGCTISASGGLSCWGLNILTGTDPVGVSMPMPAMLSCSGN